MKDLRIRKFSAVLSLFAAYSLLTTTGKAQAATTTTTTTTTATSADQEPQVLEKYVVTGSNIPMAAEAVSIPVATIDATVMQDSGVSSDILDILRKVSPNITGIGAENAQVSTGSTYGGAQANVKGLPTLILVDGRRVVDSPAGSVNGDQFVDLNMIPPAAIERIEILQDGASAIYGSDAIGGVINFILKKNYNGWETGAHYGISTDSGRYEERSGYITGGVSNDTTSITLTADYAQHNQLFLAARPYTNPIYGTYTAPGTLEIYDNLSGSDQFYKMTAASGAPPGGGQYTIDQLVAMGDYTPETTAQAFHALNLAAGETLIGSMKRYSTIINVEHKIIGDKLVAFGNIEAVNTKTASQLNAQPLVPFLEDAWTDINVEGFSSSPPPAGVSYIPNTASTNPFSAAYLDQNQSVPGPGGVGSGEAIYIRNRYLLLPRQYDNDSTLYRVVGGLKGDFTDDIHFEVAANIDRYTLSFTNPGLWDTTALQNAWADGQINQFAINNPASAFVGVSGSAFVNMISTLNEFDAKVYGLLPFAMPSGKLGFAAGVSYVRENLQATPDVNSLPNSSGTTQGWSNATTYYDFSALRDVLSEFAELNLPITAPAEHIPGAYSINIDGAIRSDKYNGAVGSSTDPQVSLSYEPLDDQFKIRASAGKSFVAPQLYSLYGPIQSGSTTSITYNPAGGGAARTAQFNQTGGANPDLKPTTAKSWSAGIVFTPKMITGLTFTFDYSEIDEKQIVGTIPANTIIQDVETNGASSPYDADVHYNTPTGLSPTAPGGISNHSAQSIYVIQNLVNLAGAKTNSADIDIDYTKKVPGVGKIDFNSVWTWYTSVQLQQLPTEQYYEYAGTASVNEGSVPKWRTYTTLGWKNFGLDAVVGMTFVESMNNIDVGGIQASNQGTVGSFTAFDLSLSYDFAHLHFSKWSDNLKVTVGVNNVADKLPPLASNVFPNTNADVGTYDGAIGRMWYVNASYRF
jgi:iron complex outermembrane receptor protein